MNTKSLGRRAASADIRHGQTDAPTGVAKRALGAVVARAPVWLPILTLLVYASTATWRIRSQGLSVDIYATALEGWQWALNGVPWLDALPTRLLEATGNPFPNWLFTDIGGHAVSTRTVGVVAAAVPFSLLIGENFALWPSTLAAVILSTSAVALMQGALQRLVRPHVALAATLVFAFATPTWSVAADSLFPHAVTQSAIAGGAWAASNNRWWLTGVALALGITGRAHLAVVAAVLGLGVGWTRRDWRIPLAVGVPATIGLSLVVFTNGWRYGRLSVSGGYDYVASNLTAASGSAAVEYLRNWLGFLVAPDRGLFLWTPVVLILLVPAWRAARASLDWTVWLALGGVAYAAIQLKINHFSGGDAFYGYRLGLESMTCLVPLLARSWNHIRTDPTRLAVVALCWLQFAVIAPGAIVGGLHVPAESVWTYSAVLVAIKDVPDVAGLALVAAIMGTWLTARHLGLLGRPTAEEHPVDRPS